MSRLDPELTPAPGGEWKRPVLSGALLGLSYLPGPFLILNLAAFFPMLSWLEDSREASSYRGLKAGFLFGLAANLVMLHFIYSMLAWSWLAAVLYVGMSIALGLRMAVALCLLAWLRRRTRLSWALLLPICWLSLEWLQTWGDLRMTGDHLAHSVAQYPFLVQFADLVGPYGVGAVLLVCNGLLFETVRSWKQPAGRRALAALAALAVGVLAYDAWAWTRPAGDGPSLRAALIQPDVPLSVKHDSDTRVEQWGTLVELTVRAAEQGAELIIWPESARPQPLIHVLDRPETYSMPDVEDLARRVGASILVGVEYARMRGANDYELYNAAMLVDETGRLSTDWGAKVHLVPFTEAIPFEGLLGRVVEGRGGEWHWLAGGFDRGPQSAVFETAGARVGVLVCFEQLFADLARDLRNRGAEVGVVITNDAWFGRSLFQTYQANALRLRAIESRMAYVRVANTGISGFVTPKGQYTLQTGLFEKRVEVQDVPLTRTPTLYTRTGDVVAWLAVASLLLLLILSRPR